MSVLIPLTTGYITSMDKSHLTGLIYQLMATKLNVTKGISLLIMHNIILLKIVDPQCALFI
jgi:hypothetical protein